MRRFQRDLNAILLTVCLLFSIFILFQVWQAISTLEKPASPGQSYVKFRGGSFNADQAQADPEAEMNSAPAERTPRGPVFMQETRSQPQVADAANVEEARILPFPPENQRRTLSYTSYNRITRDGIETIVFDEIRDGKTIKTSVPAHSVRW